jgi:hypothetical protein
MNKNGLFVMHSDGNQLFRLLTEHSGSFSENTRVINKNGLSVMHYSTDVRDVCIGSNTGAKRNDANIFRRTRGDFDDYFLILLLEKLEFHAMLRVFLHLVLVLVPSVFVTRKFSYNKGRNRYHTFSVD